MINFGSSAVVSAATLSTAVSFEVVSAALALLLVVHATNVKIITLAKIKDKIFFIIFFLLILLFSQIKTKPLL